MADLGMQVLSTVGAGVFANHIVGNPAGKLWNKIDPLGKNPSNPFNTKSKNSGANQQPNQSNGSVDNHNKSFSPEMNNYNKKIKNSEDGFEKESVNRERLIEFRCKI